MELILLKIGSIEWEYAWNWLSSHPINEKLIEPSIATNEGESWAYMGSFREDKRIIHEFRHKCHPNTKGRLDLKVQGSDRFTDDQIEKKFRL